jgi:hypothetical protein
MSCCAKGAHGAAAEAGAEAEEAEEVATNRDKLALPALPAVLLPAPRGCDHQRGAGEAAPAPAAAG